MKKLGFIAFATLVGALISATPGSAQSVALRGAVGNAGGGNSGEGACPVTYQQLKSAMGSVTVSGGLGNPMWGVVVNRNGTVCAVAYSGGTVTSQWLLSRQIAAAKAFTTNGLSLKNHPIPTIALDPLVQPGAGLFNVAFGNIQDAAAAYKGPFSSWGTQNDPMVGNRIGGMITFGGGVPLVASTGAEPVGGLGVSGDTACRDDRFSRAVREKLGLDKVSDGTPCVDPAN